VGSHFGTDSQATAHRITGPVSNTALASARVPGFFRMEGVDNRAEILRSKDLTRRHPRLPSIQTCLSLCSIAERRNSDVPAENAETFGARLQAGFRTIPQQGLMKNVLDPSVKSPARSLGLCKE